MSGSESEKKAAGGLAKQGAKVDTGKQTEPEWTAGLKQLYDAVVDEPLPDSFKDLLAKLDDESGKK